MSARSPAQDSNLVVAPPQATASRSIEREGRLIGGMGFVESREGIEPSSVVLQTTSLARDSARTKGAGRRGARLGAGVVAVGAPGVGAGGEEEEGEQTEGPHGATVPPCGPWASRGEARALLVVAAHMQGGEAATMCGQWAVGSTPAAVRW